MKIRISYAYTRGTRCLYNALNDRIRNLLLQYDYSKTTDPLQPLASHLVSLLIRDHPKTFDITVVTPGESFRLHKFILSSRSPYFKSKLAQAPDTKIWKPAPTIPPQSFAIASGSLISLARASAVQALNRTWGSSVRVKSPLVNASMQICLIVSVERRLRVL